MSISLIIKTNVLPPQHHALYEEDGNKCKGRDSAVCAIAASALFCVFIRMQFRESDTPCVLVVGTLFCR